MRKKQSEFWVELTWFEWALVTVCCLPGVVTFKLYMKVLFKVALIIAALP